MTDEKLKSFAEKYRIKISQEELEAETQALLASELQHRKYESMRTGDMLEYLKTDAAALTEEIKPVALRGLLTEALVKAVAKENQITVTREEILEEARQIARRQKVSLEMLRGFLGEELGQVRRDLLEKKALEWLETQ